MKHAKRTYIPRLADKLVRQALGRRAAVLIEGPALCGKTTTARMFCTEEFAWGDEGNGNGVTVAEPPIREGNDTVFIADWNGSKKRWDAIAAAAGTGGRFIFTASFDTSAHRDLPIHAREVAHVRMDPLSSLELGASDGSVPLSSLFAGSPLPSEGRATQLTEDILAEQLAQGGWPDGPQSAARLIRGAEAAGSSLPHPMHADDVRAFLTACARGAGVPRTSLSFFREVDAGHSARGGGALEELQARLVDSFQLIMVRNWLPARALESRMSYLTRRYPADPSLAISVAGMDAAELRSDSAFMASAFATAVQRDLRVYARSIGGHVLRHDDKDGHGIDHVVQVGGAWIGINVAYDSSETEKRAQRLVDAEAHIARFGGPRARRLAVIGGVGSHTQTLDNGVVVIPFDMLGA